MGGDRVNTDKLLEVLKLLKYGIPSNSNKSIKYVGFYQVSDWKLLDARNWKYVAEQYCGYKTKVCITDGTTGNLDNARVFGAK